MNTNTMIRNSARREFLFVGMAGGLGLTLPGLLKMEAQAAPASRQLSSKKGQAKSIIHIFLPGGMSAQETWDPKPYAPIEYRGPMGNIGTKVTGLRFGECMTKCAQIADKMTIVHSMTHGEAAHERGTHNMFTGYKPSPALQFPSFGSVISHEYGSRKSLPPYVCVPNQPNSFAGSGYLSTAYGPFGLGSDPADDKFTVRDLSLPGGVTSEQFKRRQSLLGIVDDHFKTLEKSDQLDAMDSFYQRAYSLISSPEAREAFDLNREDGKIRDRYGRHQAGQRFLMARRLVEAGVRMVSVTAGGWDHHSNISDNMKKNAIPMDQALATLISDLDERGLLDSTLVMVTSEFGRTPKINKDGGRDHFPRVFSIALAGGGIRRGYVHGKSDATSSGPDEDPLGVQDLAHTVYHQLGIDASKELMAPGDRPIEIVNGGNVVPELLA
ncbi:MAG: hypothetical protein ACI97B_001729 [Verrucomicrobiales bacterium]|jgi:hypothetical protein